MKIPKGWRRIRIGTRVRGEDRLLAFSRWRTIGLIGCTYWPAQDHEVIIRKKGGAK